jgi:hypothetical protein
MPDEPVIMVAPIESATEGPYLDDKRPTPDEIRAFTGDYLDITDPDELWAAYAIGAAAIQVRLGRKLAHSGQIIWRSHFRGETTFVIGEWSGKARPYSLARGTD